VTTTRNSAFIEVNDVNLNEIDENAASQSLDQSAEDTTLEVKKIRSVELDKHKSCVHCSAKFPPGIETNVVKCLRCGHRMLFDACQQVVACCITVSSGEMIVTLVSLKC
jgi:DNA-directed RNA polymerase subunit RPC12/RpoP